jgi:hypothetical protein
LHYNTLFFVIDHDLILGFMILELRSDLHVYPAWRLTGMCLKRQQCTTRQITSHDNNWTVYMYLILSQIVHLMLQLNPTYRPKSYIIKSSDVTIIDFTRLLVRSCLQPINRLEKSHTINRNNSDYHMYSNIWYINAICEVSRW